MFITDDFVFLHIPKTAGTFVHKVLRELYCPSAFLRKLHSLRRVSGVALPVLQYKYREVVKHTTRRRIPEACDGSRVVLLAVRNPFDHYVSTYRFDWWRKYPHRWFRDVKLVESEFGLIRDMDFRCFVLSSIKHAKWSERGIDGRRPLGPSSAEWVRYFCATPNLAIQMRNEDTLFSEVTRQMQGVRVLYMENLNQELKRFFLELGFAPQRLTFLNQAKRVYPGKVTRSIDDTWVNYYDSELIHKVTEAEWLLFRLFPNYVGRDINSGVLRAPQVASVEGSGLANGAPNS